VQATTPSKTLPSVSLVADVQVRNWGSELVLVCLDDPLTRQSYEFVYKDCREIRLSLHDAEATRATEADVIGFCEGTLAHADPAVLTTDLFELSILYGRLEIRQLSSAV
jgi:hypothetical protein